MTKQRKPIILCAAILLASVAYSQVPTQCGLLAEGAKPGPTNTGPSGALTVMSGITITTDGAIFENVEFTSGILIRANDVTIRNFKVHGSSYYAVDVTGGYSGTLLEDGEITGPTSIGIFGQGFTARRLNIHELGDDGIKARGDAVIENCWIHHLGMASGAYHADGVQIRAGEDIVIRDNYFDMPSPAPPGYNSNACIIVSQEIGVGLGVTDNVRVIRNWLNGGNAVVYFRSVAGPNYNGPPTNCRLVNNRFGCDFVFLPLSQDAPDLIVTGNAWDGACCDTPSAGCPPGTVHFAGECMSINN